MSDKELMQQALNALEQVAEYFNVDSTETKTIIALRERLAQPDLVPYWYGEFLKHNTTSEQPAQPEGCQCPACKIAPHASDCPVHNEPAWPNGPCDCGAQPYPDNFIDALKFDVAKRDSEAQPEQVCPEKKCWTPYECDDGCKKLAQPEQEPVATVVSESGNQEVTMSWWHEPALPVGTKLYTTPPASKPLTDWEIWNTYKNLWMFHSADEPRLAGDILKFARAIEAAHGITGEQK